MNQPSSGWSGIRCNNCYCSWLNKHITARELSDMIETSRDGVVFGSRGVEPNSPLDMTSICPMKRKYSSKPLKRPLLKYVRLNSTPLAMIRHKVDHSKCLSVCKQLSVSSKDRTQSNLTCQLRISFYWTEDKIIFHDIFTIFATMANMTRKKFRHF